MLLKINIVLFSQAYYYTTPFLYIWPCLYDTLERCHHMCVWSILFSISRYVPAYNKIIFRIIIIINTITVTCKYYIIE